jgi:hypothetical protein
MYGIEVEVIASLPKEVAADERSALDNLASSIRTLGFKTAVFLPRSTREQPNYIHYVEYLLRCYNHRRCIISG